MPDKERRFCETEFSYEDFTTLVLQKVHKSGVKLDNKIVNILQNRGDICRYKTRFRYYFKNEKLTKLVP